jgi:hypothetical protein
MELFNKVLAVICFIMLILSFIPFFGWMAYIYGGFATLGLILSFFGGGKTGTFICVIIFAVIRLVFGGFIGI